jgi:glycosyltransferase involved in cell wall biosynthesis
MLAQAIESVERQDFDDYEHIIVDGCSTDGTTDLLAKHPRLQVIRETDRSVYDALNKGLRAATGSIVVLLNSDDLLAPGALAAGARALADESYEIAVGTAEIFTGQKVLAVHSDPDELRLSLRSITFGNPLPNARFYQRSLLQRVGEFDLRYRLGSDRDWLLRMLRLRPAEFVMPSPVYRYRRHGESLTINDHSGLAEPLWRECLEIAEAWLSRDDLSDEERDVLRAWHRQQSIQASLHFIRHGPWSRAREFIKRGGGGRIWWREWMSRFGEAAAGFMRSRKVIAP